MSRAHASLAFGQSPLTDPRSVVSSALFHACVLLVASLTVLNAALPVAELGTRSLRAELDPPVDNRAGQPTVPGEGGGSPGEIGAVGTIALVPPSEAPVYQRAVRDPVADSLLAEILPITQRKLVETPKRALPGPEISGEGLIPGSGTGGGEGAGGGSGGGAGRGIGPGTQFFGAHEHAHSFVYVIDCSGSMATRDSLGVAKREVLASVGQLPPDAQFAVIFYNLEAIVLGDPQGRKGSMPATAANKAWLKSQLAQIEADSGTDHMLALRRALGLKPEVIFFLTDADLMSNGDVDEILSQMGATRLQAVEFGRLWAGLQPRPEGRIAT
jgi:von Willebrand factor type A domain